MSGIQNSFFITDYLLSLCNGCRHAIASLISTTANDMFFTEQVSLARFIGVTCRNLT